MVHEEKLIKAFCKYKNIIVYDIYSIKEGLFDSIATLAVNNDYKHKLTSMTLPTDFIQHGGQHRSRTVFR